MKAVFEIGIFQREIDQCWGKGAPARLLYCGPDWQLALIAFVMSKRLH